MKTSSLRPGLPAFALVTLSLLAADPAGWVPLFEGQTLNGWTQKNGTAVYRVESGTITGRTEEGSPNSFLCTDKDYGDFELEFDVKVHDRLNSGVQIRSKVLLKDGGGEKAGRVYGPQVEIAAGEAEGSLSGYIYGEATGRGWITPKDGLKAHTYFRNGEWNHFRVVAKGPRIQTWINNQPIGDVTAAPAYQTHPKGFIGLQVHAVGKGEGPYEVAWRNLRVRELK